MLLSLLKSYKDVRYPLGKSGDLQKLEVLFYEGSSIAQTYRRCLA